MMERSNFHDSWFSHGSNTDGTWIKRTSQADRIVSFSVRCVDGFLSPWRFAKVIFCFPIRVFSVFHPWLLFLFGSGDAGLCYPWLPLVFFVSFVCFVVKSSSAGGGVMIERFPPFAYAVGME